MPSDENISAAAPLAEPGLVPSVQTAGERARAAMIEGLTTFAGQLEKLEPNDFAPDTDGVDLDNPKLSLIRHLEVRRAILLCNYLAVMEEIFRLKNFEAIAPDDYLAELETELQQCRDPHMAEKIRLRLTAARFLHKSFPIKAQARLEAATCSANLKCAATALLNTCESVVNDWIEKHPSETLYRLLGDLKKLQAEKVSRQLGWFGLADFVATESTP